MKPLPPATAAALRGAPTRIALAVTAAAAAAALDVPELKDEWRHQELASFLAAPPLQKTVDLTAAWPIPPMIALEDLKVDVTPIVKQLYGMNQFPVSLHSGYRCRASGYAKEQSAAIIRMGMTPSGLSAQSYRIDGDPTDGEWVVTRIIHQGDGRLLVELARLSLPAAPAPGRNELSGAKPYWIGLDGVDGKDSTVINMGPVA